MKYLLFALGLATSLCSQTVAQTVKVPSLPGTAILNGFNNATDLNQFVLRDGATLSLKTGLSVTGGAASAQVTFPNGATGYPAMGLVNSAGTWDFTNYGGVVFDLTNTSSNVVRVTAALIDVNGKIGNGTVSMFANSKVTYRIGSEQLRNSITSWGVQRLSNPWQTSLQTIGFSVADGFDYTKVKEIRFFSRNPQEGGSATFCIDELRLLPAFDPDTFAITYVDRYGQLGWFSWPGKLSSDSEFATRRAAEAADLAANPAPADQDPWGAWLNGPKFPTTLFFTTKKDANGRWWLVTPKGLPFFATGVGLVTPRKPTAITGRETMFQWLPDSTGTYAPLYTPSKRVYVKGLTRGTSFDFYGSNLATKYQTMDFYQSWRVNTGKRMRSWGFNTLAAFSDPLSYEFNPRIQQLLSGGLDNKITPLTGYWAPMPDVFDSRFADSIAYNNSAIINQYKWDGKLIGYFVDSEMTWSGGYGPVPQYSIVYATWASQGGIVRTKGVFVSMMEQKYGTIDALNAAWGTSFRDWAFVQRPVDLPAKPTAALLQDCSDMLLAYARQYFSSVRVALKTLDPNHLYFGNKLTYFSPEVIKAADEFCDVISINHWTTNLAAAPSSTIYPWLKTISKPVLIGEFHAGSMERGLPQGGIYTTLNDAGRASYYDLVMSSAAKIPNMVGCCWFQYVDSPVAGEDGTGQCLNNGLVDVTDTPYASLVRQLRLTNAQIYKWHNQAGSSPW